MKENKEKKEKTPMDKAKKKKIIKRSVIGVITGLIVFSVIANSIASKNMAAIVNTTRVVREDVEQLLSTSGTVRTQETKTYFSQVALEVGEINVAAGDMVKKGQILFTYDEKALANEKQLAELRAKANEGGYESSLSKDNQYIRELGEANLNLGVLEQQIEDSENYVKTLNQKITDKQNALAYEGTLLQISLLDWADQPDSEEYMNLQKLVQLNAYEQQHNKEIEAWQKEISEYQDKIAAYKEYQAEMKSQKNASENGAMDNGGKNQFAANAEIEKINAAETLSAVAAVENGVTADFDGVVTEISLVEGATTSPGMQLLTLESTEKVKIEIFVSKYDLSKIAIGQETDVDVAGHIYQGKVSKINGMATTNASGAAVVGAEIEIENPDENIFLGVEAKVKIHTAYEGQVLAVPIEVINSDKDGEFVYAVEDGKITKRRVVTGISSDTFCEIQEGLEEGMQIVSDIGANLEEGMSVTAIPAEE